MKRIAGTLALTLMLAIGTAGAAEAPYDEATFHKLLSSGQPVALDFYGAAPAPPHERMARRQTSDAGGYGRGAAAVACACRLGAGTARSALTVSAKDAWAAEQSKSATVTCSGSAASSVPCSCLTNSQSEGSSVRDASGASRTEWLTTES